MATQKEVRTRIASVKNIQKITRAMEMVAAARLRRAEQRIAAMRSYAQAIRKMTRRVAEAAEGIPRIPLLEEREDENRVGILLVTGDRGLAGAFNTQIIRAGVQLRRELESSGAEVVFHVVGRRGNSSLEFRGEPVEASYVGFTDRPGFANAREIGDALTSAYVDEVFGAGVPEPEQPEDPELAEAQERSLWIYEPEPEHLLPMLFKDYVDLSVFRALLEATASDH